MIDRAHESTALARFVADVEAPEICPYCEEPILSGEPWKRVTQLTVLVLPGPMPLFDGPSCHMHSECLMRQVVGSVGHQFRHFGLGISDFGLVEAGLVSIQNLQSAIQNEADPPGVTRREAAIAAAELFERRTREGGG